MLNKIFSGMIVASLVYSLINGTYTETISGGLSGATDALSLMFTLTAVMSFWSGMMKIAKKAGITDNISKFFKIILKPLFKDVKDDEAFSLMSMNITANLLGMGNAATPLGISAMKKMKRGNVATDGMCLFAVLNTASIQLIPSTILAIRMAYNSRMPYAVIAPVWISSIAGLMAGVISVKLMERRKNEIY